jgi:hydroxybutyrate-dimer hydrolase
VSIEFLASPVRETAHRGSDDLLSAGLGLAGLRGAPTPFADATAPTPQELRRRAIQSNWKGIADLAPLGSFGEVYGSAPDIPGREFHAFAQIAGARALHRVLAQIPDAFDAKSRCLVVTASSGSRGIYGAIALAGAFGLPRGCAVAYTDKGAGSGYFDCASATGVTLDGSRAGAGNNLEFEPDVYTAESGIAIKHAHSGDNPECHWGHYLLQAAAFGLAMLERALPQLAPFTPANTRIIAVGLSNGGAAVLQAAGLDADGWLDAAVAVSPNVHVPGRGRPLYDYATEAGLLMPSALLDARFDAIPYARVANGLPPPAWNARIAGLRAADLPAAPADALAQLHEGGWSDAAIATAATTTAFALWRAFAVTYGCAYTRSGVGRMPGGFCFVARDNETAPARAATPRERAAWWADAIGIAPGAGVFIYEPVSPASAIGDPADPALPGQLGLRALWTGDDAEAARLRASIAACAVQLPRADLPICVVHGREDGLIAAAFSSDAYIGWLRDHGRDPLYWPLAHAQHFESFLALPGFGDRYVPMLPYAYAALEHVWRHLIERAPLHSEVPAPQPRGAHALSAARLGL